MSDITPNRCDFSRIASICLLDVIFVPPFMLICLVVLIFAAKDLPFWPGWSASHKANYGAIPRLTSEEWKSAGLLIRLGFRFKQWMCPCISLYTFVLYGLTEQKRAQYRSIFRGLMRSLGPMPPIPAGHSVITFEPGHQVIFHTEDGLATNTT